MWTLQVTFALPGAHTKYYNARAFRLAVCFEVVYLKRHGLDPSCAESLQGELQGTLGLDPPELTQVKKTAPGAQHSGENAFLGWHMDIIDSRLRPISPSLSPKGLEHQLRHGQLSAIRQEDTK